MSMSSGQSQFGAGADKAVRAAPARRSRLRALGESLLVAAITLALIAGLLELGLRLFVPQVSPEMQSEALRGFYVADPQTVYRNAPNARASFRLAEASVTFATNGQGLRESGDVGPPAQGVIRLLCIGDSFTFGWAVEANQAYPYLLNGSKAADGTRIQSINAGVNGYGTDNEAAWLGEYGWALQPKIVLVAFFVGNDVRDDALGMNKTRVDSTGNLVPTDPNEMPDTAIPLTGSAGPLGAAKNWLARNSYAYVFLRRIANDLFAQKAQPKVRQPNLYDTAPIYFKSEPADLQAGWDKATISLDRMRAEAAARGATLVLVAIPAREQVEDNYWQQMKQAFGLSEAQLNRDLPQSKLAAWSQRTATPYIDLLPGFRAAPENTPLYYGQDPHWNPAGHAMAARLIKEGLVKLGLFSP